MERALARQYSAAGIAQHVIAGVYPDPAAGAPPEICPRATFATIGLFLQQSPQDLDDGTHRCPSRFTMLGKRPPGVYTLALHAARSAANAENREATGVVIFDVSPPEAPYAGGLDRLPTFAPGNCCTRCIRFARFVIRTSAYLICRCGRYKRPKFFYHLRLRRGTIDGSPPSASWAGCFPVPHSFGGNPLAPISSAFNFLRNMPRYFPLSLR